MTVDDIAEGACACITEMIKKGMSSPSKLELIMTTGVLDVLTKVCHTASDDLSEDLAPLLDVLFQEILEALCSKKILFFTSNILQENFLKK